jgi:hypothetical protein
MKQWFIYLRFLIPAYVSWNNLSSSNRFSYICTKDSIQRVSFDHLTVIATLAVNVVKLINESEIPIFIQRSLFI